jgi:uncharacterized protein
MLVPAQVADVLRRRLEHEPNILAAYLFGSVARGTSGEASDVDVALLYETAPRAYLEQPFDLEAELSGALGRSVQIVALNRAPSDLIHRVLRDGILLVDRDRSKRIAFEVRARNEYFDMQSIWARYQRHESRPT